ncbi:hypothetical protein CR513_15729, partial [Mucuna pruriens]
MDRSMINATSGGALVDKTPVAARHLISNTASNTQQFRNRGATPSRMVNEVGAIDNLRLENQLTELTSLVRQLAIGQHQPSIAARIPRTTIRIVATTESAITGKLTILRGPDEVVGNKQPRVSANYEL